MRRRTYTLSPDRAAALRPLLDALDVALDRTARIAADPVELPRRYADPDDAEVAALFAASLAYGRADVFKPVVERVLAAMGPSPAAFVREFARAPEPSFFAGAIYRFNRPPDLAALAAAIGDVRARHGSLGARFAALLRETGGGGLRAALARFAAELRDAPPVAPVLAGRGTRGLSHLLPDAAGPGASKRWNLYLRWMVRGPDGVNSGSGRRSRPPRSSCRSTRTCTAWRGRSASPPGPTRAGGRPRRSPRRCGASTPRIRCATTSPSVTWG